MARVSEIYVSNWLKAEDLVGKTVKVVIAKAGGDLLPQSDGTKQQRIIVDFVGKQKRLILNKTQAAALANIGGDDTDHWAGMEVYLSPSLASNNKGTITILPTVIESDPAGGGAGF
jgi:hypothetical protein